MQHIVDFGDHKWFKLDTREDAEADHVQTGHMGAFPFWHHTEHGHKFYILRDGNDQTFLTTLVFQSGLTESKVNAGDTPDFHHNAVQVLMAELKISGLNFIWGEVRGPERLSPLDLEFPQEEDAQSDRETDEAVPLPGR